MSHERRSKLLNKRIQTNHGQLTPLNCILHSLSTYKLSTKTTEAILISNNQLKLLAGKQNHKRQRVMSKCPLKRGLRAQWSYELEIKLQQFILFNLTNKQRTWPIHTVQLCWIRVKHNPSIPCVRSPFFLYLWVRSIDKSGFRFPKSKSGFPNWTWKRISPPRNPSSGWIQLEIQIRIFWISLFVIRLGNPKKDLQNCSHEQRSSFY